MTNAEFFHDMKRKTNSKGDLRAFLSALVVNVGGFLTMCAFFMMVHRRYPLMFSDNVLKGLAPRSIPETYFGWVEAAWNVTFEEIEKTAGLDAAMFMEFIRMALRLCAMIGVPMVLILCPLHYFAGHDAVGDRLSEIGMGNIVEKHGGYAYWVHAVFVWFIVFVTMRVIFEFQGNFITKRYDWLLRMPAPRSRTVMVEGIPEEHCTDEGLRACFEKLFPDNSSGSRIETAYMVRKTRALEGL